MIVEGFFFFNLKFLKVLKNKNRFVFLFFKTIFFLFFYSLILFFYFFSSFGFFF
jgi:hypothetical protein